jgi:hypothetical protein
MAARIPRRSFATPFVVTFTAACSTTTQPPPTQPPPTETPTGPIATTPPPTDPTTNQTPPPPTPDPKPDVIHRNPPPVDNDPTHVIHRNPPDVTTPPPRNPPPPPPVGDRAWTVFKHGDKCESLIKVECPHGKPGEPMPTCNPPASHDYACPSGMTDTQQLTIVTRGTICIIEPGNTSCPPNMHCNPPPQRKVPCPE